MALGKGLQSLLPQQKPIAPTSVVETKTVEIPSKDRIWQIPLSKISPNPSQPRKQFSHQDLEDLVQSIKKHGVLQPITVTEKTDGSFELIAGERRFRASQIAARTSIPAIVRAATEQEKLELALIENIQRQDLNPIEEAFAYKRLIEEFNLTQQEAADQVGKNRSTVANIIRLLDLPEIIQKALMDGKLSVGKAKALLSLKTEKEQMTVFSSLIGESATVRDAENIVASHGAESRKGLVRKDPNIRAQEQLIEDRLGTKVHITTRGERGTIVIEYYSREELKRLITELT